MGIRNGVQRSRVSVIFDHLESLASYWREPGSLLRWDCIFVSPPWLEVWWKEFGQRADLYLYAIKEGGAIIGVAPLLLQGEEAFFIGSDDVCDCLDFVVVPGAEQGFFSIFLDDLSKKAINRLNLRLLRPDSTVLTHLVGLAKERGYQVSCKAEDVSLELDLPPTWDQYLGLLNRKQRHEVRRKIRRLWERGDVNYRIVEDRDSVEVAIDLFLGLFQKSKEEKESFLTTERESFFRSLARSMAQAQLLRIGILELDKRPVAATMGFDYNDMVYLYNSGYDPQYSFLSVGLISKILCIKDSIERGKKRFDFLKGAEVYKYRLGGKEIPLHGCQIVLR